MINQRQRQQGLNCIFTRYYHAEESEMEMWMRWEVEVKRQNLRVLNALGIKKRVKNTEGNMRSQLAVCEYKSSTFFCMSMLFYVILFYTYVPIIQESDFNAWDLNNNIKSQNTRNDIFIPMENHIALWL